MITEAGKTEITKETYLTLKESGQNVQMEEQEVGRKNGGIYIGFTIEFTVISKRKQV